MERNKPAYLKLLLKRLKVFLTAHWKSGRYLETIIYAVFYLPLHGIMILFFKMDNVFYRDLKNIKVEDPIIVIGHPRSGTTSLQRYIAQTGSVAFSTLQTILFPSIILLKLFSPLARFFGRFDILDSEKKGHKMELSGIEEDEGLFLHTLNSEILTVFCPWLLLNRETRNDGLRAGLDDLNDEESDMPFLRDYIKRQLLLQKKNRVLLKTNPSVLRIKKILKFFPDARFIFIYRDPVETIPSFLSLHYYFINKRLNGKQLRTYINQKYRFSFWLYHYFERVRGMIPAEQLLTVEFEDLKRDPSSLMRRVADYAGLDIHESFFEDMKRRSGKKHRKKHDNRDLSLHGITADRIKKDFSLIRAKYGHSQG